MPSLLCHCRGLSMFVALTACMTAWAQPPATDSTAATDTVAPIQLVLGKDGKITLEASGTWKANKPRFNIVDYEFEAPGENPDDTPARVTVMGAGGDVKSNIERWKGQFQDAARKLTTKELVVADQQVHLVDISGTYLDRPAGPMMRGSATPRENYRVLAAILSTTRGRYYVKMYGPRDTVEHNVKAFDALVHSLRVAP